VREHTHTRERERELRCGGATEGHGSVSPKSARNRRECLGIPWISAVSPECPFFPGCLPSLCLCPPLWRGGPGPGFASPACSG